LIDRSSYVTRALEANLGEQIDDGSALQQNSIIPRSAVSPR
jgi:hypothetical protein